METTSKNHNIGTPEWIGHAFSFRGEVTGDYASKLDKIQAGYQNLAKLITDLSPEGYERFEALSNLRNAFVFATQAIVQKGAPGRGNA